MSSPSPVSSGTLPSPVSSATAYVIAAGDTLSTIAQRFGVTVSQILAANPELEDADQIRRGDTLIIPPPDAPSSLPSSDGISDTQGDLTDPSDQPVFGPGYGDIRGLGVRVDPETLYVEVVMVSGAPSLDPEVEQLDTTVYIDTDGDDDPEARLLASNTLTTTSDYGATLEDLETGAVSDVTAFPGVFTVGPNSFIFEVSRATLGDPRTYAVAASVERRFYPGGLSDPEVETTIDRSPDQQYPRANPRWVEVSR